MDKKLIVYTIAGLMLYVAFGLYFYGQNETVKIFAQKNTLLADVSVLQTKSVSTTTPTTTPATILALGDMMLDRKVREQINKNGPEYPFAEIKDFLQGNDVVVANAEGPFTNNKSVTLGKKDAPLQFTFDPAILPTLKNLGFTLLDQANNHSLNFGTAGLNQSTSSIELAGLNWFGDPTNKNVRPCIADIHGEKIAFIGYNEFSYQGTDNVLREIIKIRKDAAFIVVYPHWGEEYKLFPTFSQQKVAHLFIDAGADAVIGTHPHVIEPIEIYKNKIIFYSIGNFIFDQAENSPTSKGLAVKISLTSDVARYDLFPFSIIKQQAKLMSPENRQTELNILNVQTGTIILSRGKLVK